MTNIKKNIYKKLVRDNVPALLRLRGVHCEIKSIEGAEFAEALDRKLQEEVLDYLHANNGEHHLQDLANILEIIHEIAALKGIRFQDVEEQRRQIREDKGGYGKHLFLEKTATELAQDVTTSNCIFCKIAQLENEEDVIEKFAHCYVIPDANPVTKGHLLIIPYQHIPEWFSADEKVQLDIMHAVKAMKAKLDSEYKPDGYNIGLNCGRAAGQTIPHLHLHLIPRYVGDVKEPRGGVRGVIPSKQNY